MWFAGLCRAFWTCSRAPTFPATWLCLQTAEWFELTASEILRNKFREGCLKVPGFDRTGLGLGGHVGWLCLWSSTFAESWGKNEWNQSVYDGIFCAWLIFNDMFCERMIQVVFGSTMLKVLTLHFVFFVMLCKLQGEWHAQQCIN